MNKIAVTQFGNIIKITKGKKLLHLVTFASAGYAKKGLPYYVNYFLGQKELKK